MTCYKPKLILCFVLCLTLCQACPSVCACKWKNGKQTTECAGRDLLAIPKGIDSGTQVLEFSNNNLMMLTKEKFLRMELTNLQRIYLSQCRISTIDDHTFKGLTNLVELDLSNNLLVSVPAETFIDCPALMKLLLSSNPIKAIRKDAFSHLAYLHTLELSNCEVLVVEEGAFRGLHSLEWLYLDGNKLTTLRGSRALPQSLRGAEFQGNPWECDCHIVDFHAWLLDFNLPHSVQPLCTGPARLAGQVIRSIAIEDLACLPNVSPTTFYLEVGEGKNVSLLCHTYAIPEARVAWWFQGRVLQNDTIIAPRMHLIYYIEEGAEDKRSELFIYNTNREDNGTFICSAENNAGIMQSNFTIKIIIKEDPTELVVSFTFQYVLMLLSSAAALAVILVCLVLLYAVKTSRARSSRKRNTLKIATLSNSTKDSLLQDSADEYSENLKDSSNTIAAEHQQEMMLYSRPRLNEDMYASPVMTSNQLRSPSTVRPYHLEQNPDLINDTESVGRHCEGSARDEVNRDSYGKAMENAITDFELPPNSHPHTESVPSNRETYSLSADVHLNPIGLLNAEDCRTQFTGSFYRTLPHKRRGQPVTATYPREAEFFAIPVQPAAFEHFTGDVRHTADGYPVRTCPGSSLTAEEAAPSIVQWPHCLPGNLHAVSRDTSKRCVAAQTESADATDVIISVNKSTKPVNKTVFNVKVHDVLTESPDEGYEGDVTEPNSNPS